MSSFKNKGRHEKHKYKKQEEDEEGAVLGVVSSVTPESVSVRTDDLRVDSSGVRDMIGKDVDYNHCTLRSRSSKPSTSD